LRCYRGRNTARDAVLVARRGMVVALTGCSCAGGNAMSRAGVGTIIDKLLTDEVLRVRFALDRIETVAELCLRGADLTRDEVDLFCWTDDRLWLLEDEVVSQWQH
jgi:hypothetical protein